MGSMYGVHKDPKLFPNPDTFDPERFLDDCGSVINSNLVIPWSIGEPFCYHPLGAYFILKAADIITG